jgi:hypothetical protein
MIRPLVRPLSAGQAIAQPLDVEALARRPGTTVTKRMQNGVEITELSRAGVVIFIDPNGGMSMDRTRPTMAVTRSGGSIGTGAAMG